MALSGAGAALVVGTALGYALAVAAYVSGLRIRRLRRLPDWDLRPGRPLPEPVQWHLLVGVAAGLLLFLAALTSLGAPEVRGLPLPTLAAAFLAVLSGAARVFLGGSGRLHLLAVTFGLPVLLANALWLLLGPSG